jgi:hypothetical protein
MSLLLFHYTSRSANVSEPSRLSHDTSRQNMLANERARTPHTKSNILAVVEGEEMSESVNYRDAKETASVSGGPVESERRLRSNFSTSRLVLPEIVEESDESEYVSVNGVEDSDSDSSSSEDSVTVRFLETPASSGSAEIASGEESDVDSYDGAHNDTLCGGSRSSKCKQFSRMGSIGSLVQDDVNKGSTADAAKCNKNVINSRADNIRVQSKNVGDGMQRRKESPAQKINEFMKTFYGDESGSEKDDYNIDDDEDHVHSNGLNDNSEVDLFSLASSRARDKRAVRSKKSVLTACTETRDQQSASTSVHSMFDGEEFVSKPHSKFLGLCKIISN